MYNPHVAVDVTDSGGLKGGLDRIARVQSVAELAEKVAGDTALQDKIKADPAGTIASLAAPLQSDVWIYRLVVGALGLVVLLAVGGTIGLGAAGKTIRDVLTAIGSAAVGALAGLLAPSPRQ